MVVIDNLYTAILGIKNQNYKTPPSVDKNNNSLLTLISDIWEHRPDFIGNQEKWTISNAIEILENSRKYTVKCIKNKKLVY